MSQTQLATAADYADVLLTARRAKALLTSLLLFVLISQLALFFLLRFWKPLPSGATPMGQHTRDVIQYFVGLQDIAGLILPALLTVVLYLILKVHLIGRLLGVARLTTAFLSSTLLCLLLFPWQAVLNNPAINADPVANSLGMKIPGVLYTWAEISNPVVGANFSHLDPPVVALHWARYVGFPILAVLVLTMIHLKSQRGLRQSLASGNPQTTIPSL
jgi:hypothetical protein